MYENQYAEKGSYYMKKIFEFDDNKTFFGLMVYPLGVKLSDIEKLPFSQFFNDSHAGSTMGVENGENYIYLHDWENFCRGFILTGMHRYCEDFKNLRLDKTKLKKIRLLDK